MAVYNVQVKSEKLRKRLLKEKNESGKAIHRIVAEALNEYFKRRGK